MAYSPDAYRLSYNQSMDALLPSYDSPTTLHDVVGDYSLNPEELAIKAEEELAEELERYRW